MNPGILTILLVPLLVLATGCTGAPETEQASVADEPTASAATEVVPANPDRNAYFGDLHVHTQYSFDAYLFGTRTGPDESYRFAKGAPIKHASGIEVQLDRPLDFQAVTDHATYLGMLPAMMDLSTSVAAHPAAAALREGYSAGTGRQAFNAFLPRIGGQLEEEDDLLDLDVVRSAWKEIAESAEKHYEPGRFTTFIAYEYTAGGADFENLHRNVIFEGSAYPELPFSRLDSTNPEDMWSWLDGLRDEGIEGLAIPHNSNGSNGWMFQSTKFGGAPIDAAYAEQRMRNEPLVEITQVKGTSDTHPLLSPNDEWANFEIMPLRIASSLGSQESGSYVREAYRLGLELERSLGANPYQFGLIGSSDTHNSAGSFEEDNYWSKTGLSDIQPVQRGSVPVEVEDGKPRYAHVPSGYWGASGLAGVWAESNTREAIYGAMRRKETFATSGPRIPVRLFAGYNLPDDMVTRDDAIAQGYATGTPMGGDVLAQPGDAAPRFFAWASRDPETVPLARLQIIKGWLTADGSTEEQVFDVACPGGASPNPETHRCPDGDAGVDITTCAATGSSGAAELMTLWRDPAFDPKQRAFYYVRVLENPKCRWSTWDAVRAGTPPNPDMPATIQDRAWSSPIWFAPPA